MLTSGQNQKSTVPRLVAKGSLSVAAPSSLSTAANDNDDDHGHIY
jgi:hypothetical protein